MYTNCKIMSEVLAQHLIPTPKLPKPWKTGRWNTYTLLLGCKTGGKWIIIGLDPQSSMEVCRNSAVINKARGGVRRW